MPTSSTDDIRDIAIDLDALRSLASRMRAAMSPEDSDLLQATIEKIIALERMVRQRGTTIARLKRLFHLSGSEKTADVLGDDVSAEADAGPTAGSPPAEAASSSSDSAEPSSAESENDHVEPKSKKGKNKGRTPAKAYKNAKKIPVKHPDLASGSVCPACERAKLYRRPDPACIVGISGGAPLQATCWELESLRCASCGEVYTAPPPPEAAEAQDEKYSESAAAMIAVLHYGAGMPFYRLDKMQASLHTPLPSSTQWDIMHERAKLLMPAYNELVRLGAGARLAHTDDSYARILCFMGKRRDRLVARGELDSPERTGLFTTGVIALTNEEKALALFFSGRKHAGENLAELLKQRAKDLEPLTLMCDALSRNHPVGHDVVEANCLQHGRRNVVDEVTNFPDECREILERLRVVFELDAHTRREKMSDDQRLRYLREHARPVLVQLRLWMRKQLRQRRVEENSGLGAAIRYLIKHWRKLTLFLRRPGVPLTNNIVERALKKAILYRKNSYFFRSEKGARVADLYMSLIHTAELHGANAFDYLTELQRHFEEVAVRPHEWMPWNYRATLERIAAASADASSENRDAA
jgi:hypothetical protein